MTKERLKILLCKPISTFTQQLLNSCKKKEDEEISLPADTLNILNEFLREKAEREQQEAQCISGAGNTDLMFEEDWQLSQFWYSEATKDQLGKIVQKLVSNDCDQIALLSCPSLYKTVKGIHPNVKVFEYDKRFSAFGDDFVFYDFNEGETPSYLSDHAGIYELIIADPPFLSEECITKISHIIKRLQKPNGKIIFCSGEVVEPWIQKTLDLKKCKFRPEHERNLGNEFVSYANFNLDDFIQV